MHGAAVLLVVGALFNIIHAHRYEYYYAWAHSSNHLPVHFMISCFWEGQEGSFLLWIFWHVVIGLIIMRFSCLWEAPVMAVFSGVQLFLVSMILGVVIGDLKIGSSPFILLRDPNKYPAAVVMYTFYTEGGQPQLGLISAFSLLYSIPVVIAYLVVSRRYGFRFHGGIKS